MYEYKISQLLAHVVRACFWVFLFIVVVVVAVVVLQITFFVEVHNEY